MTDLSRREALVIAGACACCAMSADLAVADAPSPSHAKSLDIGKVADYPTPGFYDKFAKTNKVLISKLDDRLVAMTAICTHKGCTVKINPDDGHALKCPCHKAEFSEEGTPTAGPARTALVRYALKQSKDGTITADLTKTFIESKWDDAAAFISLKPVDPKAPKPTAAGPQAG